MQARPTRSLRAAVAASLMVSLVVSVPREAAAHGLFGHVHVTGWAVENMPPGELRDFFAQDPELMQAALSGAMFPDTGYALGTDATSAYGEHSHWEPFIQSFIEAVRTQYGPTYDTPEERRLVAFLMGAASHGLQDELFDSCFMFESEQRDGAGQDLLDPGTDGFLVQDGHARLYPGPYFPIADLLPLYAGLPQASMIDAPLIEHQISVVKSIYVNDGFGKDTAEQIGADSRASMPWASTHYLDYSVAGAHAAEINPTMRHMQALWDRLHGTFDDANLVVHRWPDAPRRLREADHTSVASWVTFVLGKGMQPGTATATLVDSNGTPHPFELAYTRWGGVTRIVRFKATADYVPGMTYTATLEAGATLVDGSVTTHAFSHTFQVECATAGDAACPALPVIVDPRLEPEPVPVPEPEPEPTHHSDGCATAPASPAAPSAMLACTLALIAATLMRNNRRKRR